MKILITGASSVLGQTLNRYLLKQGHETYLLQGKQSTVWNLGQELPSCFQADALVHFAYDRGATLEQNVISINMVVNSFNGYKLLISSFSAHSKSKSTYGKSKFIAERIFTENRGSALRAGIVFGKEVQGIYGLLNKYLQVLPLSPLPFQGHRRLFVTHIDDLCEEILRTLELKSVGIIFAAHPWPISLRKLFEIISKNIGRRNQKTIGLPTVLTRVIIAVLKLFHFKSSSVDSLESLSIEVSATEISKLLPSITKFREIE